MVKDAGLGDADSSAGLGDAAQTAAHIAAHIAALGALGAHIAACRNARIPGARHAFHIGAALVGYVTPDLAAALPGRHDARAVTLAAADAPGLNALARDLAPRFGYRIRGEDFDVRQHVCGKTLAVLDRGALPAFGVIGVGVHLNGYVRRPDGLHLWIAVRGADKKLDPGKLDNLVGGGVSAGYSPWDTLIKEAAEEAALDATLIARATAVSRIAYDMDRPEGLRRDHLVCYDLELPPDFTPRPADGEVERFILMPATEALAIMVAGDRFKFNVNLVLIDFLRRHGILADPGGTIEAALAAR